MFKPTCISFILSSLYGITPAISAAVVTYFFYEKGGVLLIILDVLTGLFCLYLLLQTIIVHLQSISVLNEGIMISGMGRPYGLHWSDIDKATLRERHNILSGTDRLLILHSKQGHTIPYPISILQKTHQNLILQEVRRRVPTSEIFDKPTI